MPAIRSTVIVRALGAASLLFVILLAATFVREDDDKGTSGAAVKLAINPAQLQYLPIMLAADKGYFSDAGVDVEIVKYQGSANTQIPLLARGDLDLSPAVSGPSLFNQYTQGFRIKLVANLTLPKAGYRDGVVFVVRKDIWDEGEIRTIKDLKGHEVAGAAEGSPVDFLIRNALTSNQLTPTDVGLTHKARSPPDLLEFLRSNIVEVIAVAEPLATLAETQGLGVRWLGYEALIPWYQETYLAASEEFATGRTEDLRELLEAYFRAVHDINAANGVWTPELLETATAWTGQSAEVLQHMGGLLYYSPDGRIDERALDRVQTFWIGEGLVTDPVPVAELVLPLVTTGDGS
jgi:NitT/TauT family transport system substrate-binding protein